MVTVSGRIRAEDGTPLANAWINNHIGRTRTDETASLSWTWIRNTHYRF